MLHAIIFVLAISFDGLGVGLIYGLRRITLPGSSLLIIGLVSTLTVALATATGTYFSGYLMPSVAHKCGSLLMIAVGAWVIIQTWRESLTSAAGNGCSEPLLKIHVRPLGLIIQILRAPGSVDFDHSGTISYNEALMLGLALALDAGGAGIGAAMTGFLPLATPVVAGLTTVIFVVVGRHLGEKFGLSFQENRLAWLPGCALILLGLLKSIN